MNGAQGTASNWAPFAIGTLVVLIMLCVIYYFYYSRVDKSCVREHVKYYMPGANDTLIEDMTEWVSSNVKMSDNTGKCATGYKILTAPPSASCVICEVDPMPAPPVELQSKVSTWASTASKETKRLNPPTWAS